jgi:hypothetical protein
MYESTRLERKTSEKKPLSTTARPGIRTPNLPISNQARISRGHGARLDLFYLAHVLLKTTVTILTPRWAPAQGKHV